MHFGALAPPPPSPFCFFISLAGFPQAMDGMQKAVAKNMEATMSVPVFRVSRKIRTDAFDDMYRQLKPKGVTVRTCMACKGRCFRTLACVSYKTLQRFSLAERHPIGMPMGFFLRWDVKKLVGTQLCAGGAVVSPDQPYPRPAPITLTRSQTPIIFEARGRQGQFRGFRRVI